MSRPIHVSDRAILRYLERIVGLDIAAVRADIVTACRNANGAPYVKDEHARFIIRGDAVVTVLDRKTVPRWELLAGNTRLNAGAAVRYTFAADRELATPGEAAGRLPAKQAAEGGGDARGARQSRGRR